MKLLRNYCFQALLFVISVVMMQSCSCNKNSSLSDKLNAVVSDKTQLVLTGDIERLFEQMEIKVVNGKVELPDYLATAINGNLGEAYKHNFYRVIENLKGVDYNNALLAFNNIGVNMEALFVFGVEDESDFVDTFEKLSKSYAKGSAGDYATVGGDFFQIFVKDHLGFMVYTIGGFQKGEKGAETIDAWMKEASETPLTTWKKDYLTQEAVGTMLFATEAANVLPGMAERMKAQLAPVGLDSLASGYLGMSCKLDKQDINLSIVSMDKDGKQIETSMMGKFNEALIGYASNIDIFAASLDMNQKGYDSLSKGISAQLNQIGMLLTNSQAQYVKDLYTRVANLPSEYLSEGGMFLAASLAEDVDPVKLLSDPSSLSNYHIVFAADLKPAKAQEAFKLITESLSNLSNIPLEDTSAKSEIPGMKQNTLTSRYISDYDFYNETDKYETLTMNIGLDGNVLVISNAPIRKSDVKQFDKEVFKSSMVAMQLVLNESVPSVKKQLNLPFGVNAYSKSTGATTELNIKVTDTQKNIIPALLGLRYSD